LFSLFFTKYEINPNNNKIIFKSSIFCVVLKYEKTYLFLNNKKIIFKIQNYPFDTNIESSIFCVVLKYEKTYLFLINLIMSNLLNCKNFNAFNY
jgi:hypothetical protein